MSCPHCGAGFLFYLLPLILFIPLTAGLAADAATDAAADGTEAATSDTACCGRFAAGGIGSAAGVDEQQHPAGAGSADSLARLFLGLLLVLLFRPHKVTCRQ